MTGSFHISSFQGTLHADKIHVWFKIANITHALPVPVHRQPADRFDLETDGRFAFTSCSRCQISYRSEILAPVQQPGWTYLVITVNSNHSKNRNLFDSFVNGMEPWGSVDLKIRIRQGQPTTVFYKRYVRKHCLQISIAWENLNMVVLFVFRISIVSTIFGSWAGFLF